MTSTGEREHRAALAAFEHMTTARLLALCTARSAADAFAMVAGRTPPSAGLLALYRRFPGLEARWVSSAQSISPAAMGERCAELGVEILVPGDRGYPPQLLDDPRRPAVLFVQGDVSVLDARRVGIVGTRNPTRRGAQTSARFAHELAAQGVCVVSGLALGIDGAAHRGALAAGGGRPAAVVANGHGQPYPRRHTALWNSVAEQGVIVSEWPPGTTPDAFRFPQRNRILAALSELVVVVESRERGGSLITAREAAERGIDVFAVPGPIDERASAGTNALLDVGAIPVSTTETLLVALGLDGRRAGRRRFDSRPTPTGDLATARDRCDERPQSVESLSILEGWDLSRSAMALARLERSGWIIETEGWFERLDEYAEFA